MGFEAPDVNICEKHSQCYNGTTLCHFPINLHLNPHSCSIVSSHRFGRWQCALYYVNIALFIFRTVLIQYEHISIDYMQ